MVFATDSSDKQLLANRPP